MVQHRSPVTLVLLALVIGIHALLAATHLLPEAVLWGGFIPARFGGMIELAGAAPAWATPVTSAFLHGDWIHLGLNAVMLLFLGPQMAFAIGEARMAALYVAGMLVAALSQYLVEPASIIPVIGASGAISALFGAYAILFARRRAKPIGPVPAVAVHALWVGAFWIGLQLLFGFAFSSGTMQIAIWAHIGGFLTGIALALPLLRWHRPRPRHVV